MTNYNLTDVQKDIITSDSPKMLVSASAGTGKTFVMVQRICDLIVNKNKDISSFLVVTFTTLAANEMSERINIELMKRLEDNPQLKSQIKKLPLASISTIHSFCHDLLKQYFYLANLPPKFSIIEDNKAVILKNKAIDKLFEEKYENNDPAFKNLLEIFGKNRRDDGLANTILSLYSYSRSMEKPKEFLQNTFLLKDDSIYEQIIVENIHKKLQSCNKKLDDMVIQLNDDENTIDKDDVIFFYSFINKVLNTNSLEEIVSFAENTSIPNLQRMKNRISHEVWKGLRGKIKKYIDIIINYRKSLDSVAYKDSISTIISQLSKITLQFDQVYSNLKRKKDYVDFDDLEHFTLEILQNDEAKREIHQKYQYIFVDEYQDTNKIQEAILTAIDGENLFTVGDIKQSIYAFRQCDKGIFWDREKAYKNNQQSSTYYLKDNFRSNSSILQFVNKLFSTVMTESFGTDYEKTSMFNVNDQIPKEKDVEIDIINISKDIPKHKGSIYSVLEDNSYSAEYLSGEKEGKFIANKINTLIQNGIKNNNETIPITYSDIVILVRSTKNPSCIQIYKTLLAEGIPVSLSTSDNLLFDYPEVEMCANFIQVLQNPFVDLPLLSVLKSPFFSFTDSELVEIKQASTKKYFFEAFFEGKNNEKFKNKIQNFIDTIAYYNTIAIARGGAFALTRAIAETPFEIMVNAKPNGAKHMQMVKSFINNIDSLDENKNLAELNSIIEIIKDTLKANSSISTSDSVQIMTVHKSKGLEFPIVILSNFNRNTKQKDKNTLNIHKSLGGSIKCYDLKKRKVSASLYNEGVKTLLERENMEEELRVLYVALTRAKNKLFITGTTKNGDISSFDQLKEDEIVSPEDVYESKSWLDLVCKVPFISMYANCNIIDEEHFKTKAKLEDFIVEDHFPLSENALDCNFNYQYPFVLDTTLPTKFVASNIKRQFVVEEDVSYTMPNHFIETSATLGTAYHKLLELSMPLCSQSIIQSKLDEMVENRLISKDDYNKIDVSKVFSALNSPIMSLGTPYLEKSFIINVPANMLNNSYSNKEVLVQGVIDLILVNDKNQAVIIDYKFTKEQNDDVLIERYKSQLDIYKYAVEKVLKYNVVKCAILNLNNFHLIDIIK